MSVVPQFQQDVLVSALSRAISYATVSGDSTGVFLRFHALLRELFPALFAACQVREVPEGALLLKLPGESAVRPLVFCGHMDVVPVHNRAQWRFDPFVPQEENGYLYGRGAADMKSHLICLLYAAEQLVKGGWRPKNDIWFALSSDEEVRGGSMARMVRILQSEGVQPALVLDEGGFVSAPYVLQQQPAALVGTGENGVLLFTLTCDDSDAMEKLIRAAARLSFLRFRLKLHPPMKQMLHKMAPLLSKWDTLMVKQLPATSFLLLRRLGQTGPGKALTQTRLWIKSMQGEHQGDCQPALFYQASIPHGESAEVLLMRIHRRIRNLNIRLHIDHCDEPSRLSPAEGEAYEALETAIRVHFPGVLPLPGPIAGGTDSRRFESICRNIYRFSPFRMTMEDLSRIHHTDERIRTEDLPLAASFFSQMLQA